MTTGTSAASAEGFAPGMPERVMRKAQLRLLPLLFFAYMIAIIDRANISFAAQTMNADLGFSASVFGFAGGIFSAAVDGIKVAEAVARAMASEAVAA